MAHYPLGSERDRLDSPSGIVEFERMKDILSVFAKVVEWSERRSIGGMKVDFEPGDHGLGCLLKPRQVIPPAMAGELVLEVAPESLNQVDRSQTPG